MFEDAFMRIAVAERLAEVERIAALAGRLREVREARGPWRARLAVGLIRLGIRLLPEPAAGRRTRGGPAACR